MRLPHSVRNRRRRIAQRVSALAGYIGREMPGADRASVWIAMFCADLTAFRDLGKSITGGDWFKTPDGPRIRLPTRAA